MIEMGAMLFYGIFPVAMVVGYVIALAAFRRMTQAHESAAETLKSIAESLKSRPPS